MNGGARNGPPRLEKPGEAYFAGSAASTARGVSSSGSTTGRSCPGIQRTLNGTAARPYLASSVVIWESLFVQSPSRVAMFWSWKAFRTSGERKTRRLLAWQVAHQRAVKST